MLGSPRAPRFPLVSQSVTPKVGVAGISLPGSWCCVASPSHHGGANARPLQHRPSGCVSYRAARYGARGPIFRVTHSGKVLLARSHCPLFEACRALLDKGITGRLELWRPGKPSFDAAVDIGIGAQLTIVETEKVSIRLARWASWWDAVSRVGVEARTATDGSRVLPPTPEDQTPKFAEALGK
jgi:hypothetical protein